MRTPPKPIYITPHDLAARFMGIREVKGSVDNPAIMAMLKLDASWVGNDETPWCSAFVNYVAWLLGRPRSKSLAARSWLRVGSPVALHEARMGFDVVIFQRGGGHQPGPEVLSAPGHVAFFSSISGGDVTVIGGNQGDSVSIGTYPQSRILGIREI
tara:strand:- start:14923 stop:15390 length:468 start_codon:yes stop_codon:yes gene_type:complete